MASTTQMPPVAATPQGYQGSTRSVQVDELVSGADVVVDESASGTEGDGEGLDGTAEEQHDEPSAECSGNDSEANVASEDQEDTSATAPPSQNNLIINYLPSHVTEIELRNMFAVHGDLAHVKVVYDRSTGKSMGYGFVKFTTNEAAAAAMAAINGMAIDHKRIKVSVARPSSKDIKNSKLYVTNLPDHFNQDQVIEVFQQYGKIIECRTLVDPKTTISRCTAFVQFDTRREAKDALKFMNGHSLPGAKKGLLVKFAEDHHRRAQRQGHTKGGSMDGSHVGGGQYGQQAGLQGMRGKGGRKGKGGGGGRGGGLFRAVGLPQGMSGRHGHGHPMNMRPGYLNPGMMQASQGDGGHSSMGQGMMGRFGMPLPGGGNAAQAQAAYNAAQAAAHTSYNMMQLNSAMGMIALNGNAGARDANGAAGMGDGSGGVGMGAGGAAYGLPAQMGGRSTMMRGDHVPQVLPQMPSPAAYGSNGAGMGYVNDMKNAGGLGGGGPVTPIKQQQQQHQGPGDGRVPLEQGHPGASPFVLRGV